jgi:hypothetical protein
MPSPARRLGAEGALLAFHKLQITPFACLYISARGFTFQATLRLQIASPQLDHQFSLSLGGIRAMSRLRRHCPFHC